MPSSRASVEVAIDQHFGAGACGSAAPPARASARQRAGSHRGARNCTRRTPAASARSSERQPGARRRRRARRDQVAIRLQQRRDDRPVGRRHRIAGELVAAAPTPAPGLRGRAACRAMRATSAHVQAQALVADSACGTRDQRRAAARRRCRVLRAVRARARLRRVSPGSRLPPGNSHSAGQVAAFGAARQQDAAARVA